jgi:hypothetical protein
MPDFGRWTSNGGDPSLNEVNRTDRFIDALAGDRQVYSTDQGEAELANLLSGWRDEVRHAPSTMRLTERDAVAALDRATDSRQRRRLSMAVVGSAAAAVLCLGGFGSVVYGATPGDSLYGLRTALFGQQEVTRDQQVVLAAQTQMAEVQQLIDQGQWAEAQNKLSTITTTVATVDDVQQKQELADQWQQLSVKVETKDASATVPADAPPVVLPEVPASEQLTITSSAASSSETTSTTSSETTTSPSGPTSTSPSEGSTSPSAPPSSAEPGSPAPQQPPSSPGTVPPAPANPPQSPPQSPPSPPVEVPAPPSPVPGTGTTTTTVVSSPREPASGTSGGGGQSAPVEIPAVPAVPAPVIPQVPAPRVNSPVPPANVTPATTTPVIDSGSGEEEGE